MNTLKLHQTGVNRDSILDGDILVKLNADWSGDGAFWFTLYRAGGDCFDGASSLEFAIERCRIAMSVPGGPSAAWLVIEGNAFPLEVT